MVDEKKAACCGAHHKMLVIEELWIEGTHLYPLQSMRNICALSVQFVDKDEAGNVIGVCLAPHRLTLSLYTRDSIEDSHGPIKHTKAPLNLRE